MKAIRAAGQLLRKKTAVFLSSILFFIFSANSAFAQVRGFDSAKDEVVGDVATLKGAEAVFSNVITVALYLAGLVLLVMFLIGGFKYMTAAGDPKAAEAAKGTFTHAIMGLVVLIFAFVILVLIKDITHVDVTKFNITH